ncbi:uncharacterized protein LOC112459265 [Temnothorax curvispinosus]|uniref:Uncharacterized protein LOC112459265 n=1 Tax=Temnothorax curvispinosus TaxID=300111 RepID=A0A6J1QCK0_9HYME|nr:uncharacterized protein LOC112459265 [Temnothorax curvispinosus]
MPVNGVRVLPDIPKNMPNMEILIREFETGFSTSASCRDTASKLSTSNDGNFVKKIVEAYESSVRASNDNIQRERTDERSSFSNALDVVKNRKNVEKNGSSPAIYDVPSAQCRDDFKKKSKIFLTSFEARAVEDDFVILNRYHSESDVKAVSETWPRSPPKINMYSCMSELSMNVQSSPSRRIETRNPKKRDKKLECKTKKSKLMICSSPLENFEDKDLDCEDPLKDILTSSYDSSTNNSYRNLQADLYGFEDELELSSTSSSLSSLKSSVGSSHNNMLSINNDDGSLLVDSSFQDVTVTFSKDIPEARDNLRDPELIPSPSSNRKSPRAIGETPVSPNEDRPIKLDNDTRETWISALGEKLSRKKPLKKLLKSAFNAKLLSYVWKKSAEEKQPSERTSDSGFIDRFPSSSSSSSQKSWCSDPNERPLTPPTFGTFGRAKNACVSDKTRSKSSRMVLTEVSREEFTSDSEPADSTTHWVPLRGATTAYKENHGNVESSLKSPMLKNSFKLKASGGHPSLPKHPYLTRNGIPKHPFVAETKLDQTTEELIEEREMRCNAKEPESDTRELEPSGTSASPVSQAKLSISYSKMSGCLASSPNNNCDILRSRSCKSTSALDGLVPQQTPVNNVHTLCNFSTDFLSTIRRNKPHVPKEPSTHRYATVSPRNFRFSMSREKSRAIERSFDA